MGTIQGLITSYDVSENKVDVSNVLNVLELPQTPLLNLIGFDNNDPVTSPRYQWWDDVLPALKISLAADYTAGAGSITVDDAKKVKIGNILKIDNSIYRVTNANTTTNVLTIVVVANDANHTNGDDVEIISDANAEGSEYQDGNYEQKVMRFNVTQIFKDHIKITGTQRSVQQYIQENVFLDEVERKMKKLKRLIERTAWLGVRVEPSDNTAPRLMGGIKYYIENDGLTASAAFSEANFNAFLRDIYNAGGVIKEAWMNPSTKANFNSLNADKLVVERGDTTAGKLIKTYLSDYGDLDIRTSPHIPEGLIFVFDSSKVKIKPLINRKMFFEELAKTGDYTKGHIVGEYTLEFANPDVAGLFTISA